MKKNYVKMNQKNCLSLGNIFLVIKENSFSNATSQNEIFCSLFNVSYINNTTVNNYCIGIRAIGVEYKKIYFDLYDEYKNDKLVFKNIILSLLRILDNKVYIDLDLEEINSNSRFRSLCLSLISLMKNDKVINEDFIIKVDNLLNNSDYYSIFVELVCYAVLENKQPLYKQENFVRVNKVELDEYLKVKLYEGVSYVNSLIFLSKKKNMYACAELGMLEYSGLVSGSINYLKAYEYYLLAADKGHPKACWMIAHMILNKKVDGDIDILWYYLNKAIDLGSNAALNTMGLCYLRGVNKDGKVGINLAIKYFLKASEMGYLFAFNNLGKVYENLGDIEKAYYYYGISADMGDSWALNKMGEYFRLNGDKKKAYFYYNLSNSCPITERCKWSSYNINKYY